MRLSLGGEYLLCPCEFHQALLDGQTSFGNEDVCSDLFLVSALLPTTLVAASCDSRGLLVFPYK